MVPAASADKSHLQTATQTPERIQKEEFCNLRHRSIKIGVQNWGYYFLESVGVC